MLRSVILIFGLVAADPVFGPKDKIEISLTPEPLRTVEEVKGN